MHPSALNGFHGECKIILAKWLDIEVGDRIPAVTNSDGCALNGSASFLSGATSDRSDSTLLTPLPIGSLTTVPSLVLMPEHH
jgi:hypothetical protein